MSEVAIRVEGLGKLYRIGASREGYKTLRDTLTAAALRPARALRSLIAGNGARPPEQETIWALKDVSFEIQRGEVVGVIGRNGAGKSTLLKILSRITEPTEGCAEIHGRVGSLLEVGTGFHGELSGRENIYLNGAILGMKRAEIDRKFDEIVAFAEVEKFIDTPVKHYSSGMYLRLAFAVAAHLDPEILLVDEVLAVGDAAFQRKCLGKMGEVARQGRTVAFISHNMAAIEDLCDRCLVVDGGMVAFEGTTQAAVSAYVRIVQRCIESVPLLAHANRTGTSRVRISSFQIESSDGRRISAAQCGDEICLVLGYTAVAGARDIDVGISFHDEFGRTLAVLYAGYVGPTFPEIPENGHFRCVIPKLPLAPGRYRVGARVVESGREADWPRNGVGFLDVETGDFYGTGSPGFQGSVFQLQGSWLNVPG